MIRALVRLGVTLLALVPLRAVASPHPLPYSYPSEMSQKGAFEVEQYTDLTPVPAPNPTGSQTPITLTRAILTTELEYGLSDQLELGLYFQAEDTPGTSSDGTGAAALIFDGIKQRVRWGLAKPGVWPIDVALYGEISEFQNELELEGKVILQRRFGHVRLMVNLWAEREFYFSGVQEWVLNPTGGVAWEIRPWISIGAEYWMHAELGAPAPSSDPVGQFNQAAHHYVGPALMLQFRKLWVSVAPYLRLDNFGRTARVGDLYGPLWVRAVIGVDFG